MITIKDKENNSVIILSGVVAVINSKINVNDVKWNRNVILFFFFSIFNI